MIDFMSCDPVADPGKSELDLFCGNSQFLARALQRFGDLMHVKYLYGVDRNL